MFIVICALPNALPNYKTPKKCTAVLGLMLCVDGLLSLVPLGVCLCTDAFLNLKNTQKLALYHLYKHFH